MKTKINPENIQIVGELIEFLKTTNSFCGVGKKEAIEFFSSFDKIELIDNIEDIPEEWVFSFCRAIRGKTIDRFRHRIKSSYYAYEWASEFRGKEIELMRNKIKNSKYAYFWAKTFQGEEIKLMRDKINSEGIAFKWAKEFRGKEIELMRSKIKDGYWAYRWASEFGGKEIDYMLNKIEFREYKDEMLQLKQNEEACNENKN